MISALVYVIENEPTHGEAFSLLLRRAGYQVVSLPDSKSAQEAFERQLPDLVIFHIPQVGLDLDDFITWVHQQSNLPILILTNQATVLNLISEFYLDEDHILEESLKPQELLNHVDILLNRSPGSIHRPPDSTVEFADLQINTLTRLVTAHGKVVNLTIKEFDLLWYLAQHPGQIFTRYELLRHIWGQAEYIDPGTITVHIHRLRLKIEADPSSPRYIRTIQGIGYKLEP